VHSFAGGDFREPHIFNGKPVRPGWYIERKTGRKIETDYRSVIVWWHESQAGRRICIFMAAVVDKPIVARASWRTQAGGALMESAGNSRQAASTRRCRTA